MHKDTLCWSCENACGGCEWSKKKARPVPGWKATATEIRAEKERTFSSFLVTECPKYKPDGSEKLKQRVKSTRKVTDEEKEYIYRERETGKTFVEIGKALNLSQHTVRDNYNRYKTKKVLQNMQ